MTTVTTFIEKRDFTLIGILDDEQDCLEELFGNHDSGYVCDVISEVADSYIPTHNNDVWKNASDIQEHIEEAIASGLAGVEGGNIDLIRIFQAGYYQYYTQSLYNNLDELAFNAVAEKVNEYLNTLTEEEVAKIDIFEVESAIEEDVDNFDNNNQLDAIDDIAKEIIERITEDDFQA